MFHRATPLHPFFLATFWIALIFAVTMALLPHPPHVMGQIWDKYQHMLAFGTLSLFAAFAYPMQPLTRLGERLSFLGALIEVAQSIPALHRDCDIFDWVADTFAIILVLLIVAALSQKRSA